MNSSNCKLDWLTEVPEGWRRPSCARTPIHGRYLGWCAVASSSSSAAIEAATMTSQRVQRLEQVAVCLACPLAFLASHSGKGWPGR